MAANAFGIKPSANTTNNLANYLGSTFLVYSTHGCKCIWGQTLCKQIGNFLLYSWQGLPMASLHWEDIGRGKASIHPLLPTHSKKAAVTSWVGAQHPNLTKDPDLPKKPHQTYQEHQLLRNP